MHTSVGFVMYGIFRLEDLEECIKLEAYYLWLNGSCDHLCNWFIAKEIILERLRGGHD